MGRLRLDGGFVEEVAQDTKGEDREGEEVARKPGVASEEACEDLVVVF
jgi:hypothetical protein